MAGRIRISTPVAAILLMLGVMGGVLVVWEIQAGRMKGNFAEAMRNGGVEGLPVDLWEKQWSESELAASRVIKLDSGAGRERAIQRSIHASGYTISNTQYSYQATITDSDTGIQHVFGYSRGAPQQWRHASIHPDSLQFT